jgi:hypothetical protein
MLGGAISGRLGFNTYDEVIDVTGKRDSFLDGSALETDESYKILIIGKPRSGKTHEALYYIDKLMKANSKRRLCLFRCPHELYEVMVKHSPWPERIYETFYLTEIQNYSVIFIDEGLISTNAKEALRTDNRQLGKALAFISHKGCIFIINAQDEGVLKDIRRKVDWIVFKRLSKMFIDESDDPLVKKYAQKLTSLKKSKSYIVSNVFGFETQGTTNTDLIDWWNDEISKNLAQASLDTEFEREKKLEEIEVRTAERLIKRFGAKRVGKSKFTEVAEGFLLVEDRYTHFLLTGRMRQVCAIAKYVALVKEEKEESDAEGKKKSEKEKSDAEGDNDIIKDVLSQAKVRALDESCTFPDYAVELVKKETDKPQFAETIRMYLNTNTYEKIGDKLKFSIVIAHRRVNWFRKAELGRKSLQGRYFERWWDFTHPGGKLAGEGGKGEVDWRDENGDIYSLKCQHIDRRVATFYQDIEDGGDPGGSLGPEYRAAKAEGKEYYYLVLFNPAWLPTPMIQKVYPSGDIRVLVWRPKNARQGKGKPVENNLSTDGVIPKHEEPVPEENSHAEKAEELHQE